jgi:ribosome biogenesis GTPase
VTLEALGWDDRVAARLADALDDDRCVAARVVRVEHDSCIVATAHDEVQRVRARVLPAVGDWVAVRDDDVVVAIAPRWSELARRDPTGAHQVLAANVDIVFVTAPADRLSLARVERETTVAWDGGARPVVLVTKCDLATAADVVAAARDRLVGVDVIATSARTADGLDEVADRLRPNRTAVLLGPSGAGKSSLTNALLGADVLATADVRATDHRGRHTTTARQLLVVPGGGVVIDTPGLRSLSLPDDHGGVAAAFPEIDDLAANCRFADCAHDTEPGCAVRAAEADGVLDPARLASFRKLAAERAREHETAPAARRRAKLGSKLVRQYYDITDGGRSTPRDDR